MNRNFNVISLGVGNPELLSAGGPQSPPNNRAEKLREKREQQEAYRLKLEYDSINSIPEERKPFERSARAGQKVDAGLCIGNGQDEREKAAAKKANQAAYRKMLDESKDLAPVTGERKKFERRSPPSSDQLTSTRKEYAIGEKNEEELHFKRQDALEYRKQLARDIQMKKDRQAELDQYDKSSMGGLNIGTEEKKSNGKAVRAQVAVNNIFPSENDGSNDNRVRQGQDARRAPAPVADVHWGQKVQTKTTQYEEKYVNHTGLTGLCVGSEGDAEQKKYEKTHRVEKYRNQLATDQQKKTSVRNNELANQRYLD